MAARSRQFVLGVLLALPLVFAALTAPPFVSTPMAQGANRMVGPNYPILVDSNGNGLPSEGSDERIVPTMSGSQMRVNTRWNCNPEDTDNVLNLSNADGLGRYQSASRLNGALTQTINFTSTTGGAPTRFQLIQTGPQARSGNGQLMDFNGDGVYETMVADTFTISTVLVDATGDGNADYVSVPWAQASAIGVEFGDSCGGTDPQIFIPLADTNADARPDSIVLDLDGNGVEDPQFFHSPPLAGLTPVPTMSSAVQVVLAVLLFMLGASFVRRQGAEV